MTTTARRRLATDAPGSSPAGRGSRCRSPSRSPATSAGQIGGPVDAVGAALVGGALTGAGLGAVQWWAADGALGRPAAWIGASAVGYAVGLAAGAALVGYDTDLGSLAVMGLVSGAALGAAQGLVLARQGRRGSPLPWACAMPVLFALGWCASTGHRHQRRRPVHGVRRRRRGAVHAAQRPGARAFHSLRPRWRDRRRCRPPRSDRHRRWPGRARARLPPRSPGAAIHDPRRRRRPGRRRGDRAGTR